MDYVQVILGGVILVESRGGGRVGLFWWSRAGFILMESRGGVILVYWSLEVELWQRSLWAVLMMWAVVGQSMTGPPDRMNSDLNDLIKCGSALAVLLSQLALCSIAETLEAA